jgi:flagella basal body P-ring formation protein FlgA
MRRVIWIAACLGWPLLAVALAPSPARAGDDAWAEWILAAAQAQAQPSGDRLGLRALRLPARLPARPDPERTRVEFRPGEDFSGPTVIGLDLDGRRTWARVTFERRTDALVAARDLPAGTVLVEGDLALRSLLLSGVSGSVCRAPEEAVGRILRSPLRAGEPVRADRLERPLVVRAGERVVIELDAGALRLRVPGQALAPGRVGDRIAVLNVQSGRRLQARVLGAKRVALETVADGGGER